MLQTYQTKIKDCNLKALLKAKARQNVRKNISEDME